MRTLARFTLPGVILLTVCFAGSSRSEPLPDGGYPASSNRQPDEIVVSAAPSSYDYTQLPSSYSLPPGAVRINPGAPSQSAIPGGPESLGGVPASGGLNPGGSAIPAEALPVRKKAAPAPVPVAPAPAAPKAAQTGAKPAQAKPKPVQAKPKPVQAMPGPVEPTAASRVLQDMRSQAVPAGGQIVEGWLPLVARLRQDPSVPPETLYFFAGLPPYSPDPMGTKVQELFRSAFMRKPRTKPDGPPVRIYRSVVTSGNVEKCKDFLAQYKGTFDRVEKRYPVPRNILVSLLMVETRLGTYIGRDNAFWSLACMAMADKPALVQGGLGNIPITSQHDAWLQDKLTDKSNWAYKELRALLRYCAEQGLDPNTMPGSVYGAIGVCQFMPSNLVPYGDDGDGDGVVNLFSVPDAVFSAAKYLTKHGWSAGIGVDKQRAVLKRYNNLNIYANTIMALAESIRTGVLQTGPPDAPAAAAKPKATAKKQAKPKAAAKQQTKPKAKTQTK